MLSTLREPSVMKKIGMSVNSAGDLPAGEALITKNGETEVVKCPFPDCKVCVTKRELIKKEEEKQEKQNNVTFQIKEMSDATEPVDNSVSEPVDNSVPEPVDNSVPEPVDNSVPEPVDNSVPEPVDNSVSEPVDNSVPEPVDNSVPEPVDNMPVVGESLNDTAKRLINYNIENQNDALNVMVGFIGLAQTRGAFSIEEAAKLHECIKLFRA
jgi:hypothetical protein